MENVLKKFSIDKDDNRLLRGVILASVGPAIGHYHKYLGRKYQEVADAKSLEIFKDLINRSPKNLAVSLDHDDSVSSNVASILPGSATVEGDNLVADIRLDSVAFTRATNWIGEYIQTQAKENPDYINLSFEFSIKNEDQEYDDTEGIVYVRPANLSGASFVKEGALTDALFAYSKIKENNMESKVEDKEKVEEVKAEELPASEVEEVKDEEVEEVKEEAEEEAKPDEKLAALEGRLAALEAKLASYEKTQTEELAKYKAEAEKKTSKRLPADIEYSAKVKVEDKEAEDLTDDELKANWKHFYAKGGAYKERVKNLR